MRILHMLNEVDGLGNGIGNAAMDLAAGQLLAGDTVVFASAGGDQEQLIERMGARHVRLDQSRRPLTLLKAVAGMRRLLEEFKPDVVHVHMMTGVLVARAAIALGRRVAVVSHVHNVHQRSSRVMGLADRVIVVSESVGRSMAQAGIPERKIRVVLNRPLGSPRLAAAGGVNAPVELEHPAVVTVAGMFERKGIADLIAAFAQVAEREGAAHLYLVGDGPDIERFREQAAQTACAARIHFPGFTKQPLSYMVAADVFVLASRRDSFPLVLLEARGAGCAIVASDADGMPQALDFGEAGVLYPAGDVGKLAQALERLLRDADEREAWKARARAGLERWNFRGMAADVGAVYADVVR